MHNFNLQVLEDFLVLQAPQAGTADLDLWVQRGRDPLEETELRAQRVQRDQPALRGLQDRITEALCNPPVQQTQNPTVGWVG